MKTTNFGHIFLFFLFLIFFGSISFFMYQKNITPKTITFFDFILLGLAIFRSTRLFVYDEITSFIRDYFAKGKSSLSESFNELLHCPWCTSVWMSLFLTSFYYITNLSWFFILILALAGVSGILQIIFNYLTRLADKLKIENNKNK